MKNLDLKNFIIYIFICALALFPIMYFPLSGDLGLFLTGVKIMNAGGLPYKDIMDIKPAILFYILKYITDVIGTGEYSLRIFDFFIQIIISSFIYLLMYKATKNKFQSMIGGILYCISYTALNFAGTQIETMIGIVVVPTIYWQVYKREKYFLFAVVGLLVGLFTGMKYTLGIILAAILIDDVFFAKINFSSLLKKYSLTAIGFIIGFGITLLPYLNPEIAQGYGELKDYFIFYASIPKVNLALITLIITELGTYMGNYHSLFLTFLLILCMLYTYKNNNKDNSNLIQDENKLNTLIRIAFIFVVLLLFSCIVERKFFSYHLFRINSSLAVLWSIGAVYLLSEYRSNTSKNAFAKFILVFGAIFFIVFSPLSRYINLLKVPYYFYTDTQKYDELYTRSLGVNFTRIQHKQVAEYINRHTTADDKVNIASTGSGYVTYLLNTTHHSKFAQSSYYVFPKANQKYIDDFANEMKEAKYTVMQVNDGYESINGTPLSTYESILANPKLKAVLDYNLERDTVIGKYIIMRNKYYMQ